MRLPACLAVRARVVSDDSMTLEMLLGRHGLGTYPYNTQRFQDRAGLGSLLSLESPDETPPRIYVATSSLSQAAAFYVEPPPTGAAVFILRCSGDPPLLLQR